MARIQCNYSTTDGRSDGLATQRHERDRTVAKSSAKRSPMDKMAAFRSGFAGGAAVVVSAVEVFLNISKQLSISRLDANND